MEIKKEVENKLLKRKELDLFFEEGAALKREEIKSQVSKKTKADEKLIVVNKITPSFGSRNVSAQVFIYQDEATLKRLTSQHITKRNTPKAAEGEEAEA